MTEPCININGRWIGGGHPCYVIAEAGVNHNGSLERALELVRVAAGLGADAVKFQTFKAADLVSPAAPKAEYQKRTTDESESQFDMIRALELDWDAFRAIRAECDRVGIQFLSSPFDLGSARFLVDMGVPALKIGSGEVTNLPFLAALSRMGVPLILSTGMADLDEVREAVECIRANGNPDLVLMHCLSSYPAPAHEYNLRAMDTLRQAFGVPVGLSDHSLGNEISVAGVALGAQALEKHFTLDCDLPGPDHKASTPPEAFRALVAQVRHVEAALGDGVKRLMPAEVNTRDVARRSVVAARDLQAGVRLSLTDLSLKRPGTGIAPKFLEQVAGRTLRTAVPAGHLISWDDLGDAP